MRTTQVFVIVGGFFVATAIALALIGGTFAAACTPMNQVLGNCTDPGFWFAAAIFLALLAFCAFLVAWSYR